MRSLFFLVLLLFGCTKQYITNTDVEDNDFNHRVIEFCEKYRHAVERRNVAQLLELADPSYYEDGGSIDTSDDIDYAGLKEFLVGRFRQTRAIRYEIRYRNISRDPKKNILVDFTFSASFKIPTPEGEVWRRQVADNRLELVQNGESFRILAGM